MNYSQQEIEKKVKNLTSTSSKMKYRFRKWSFYILILMLFSLLLMGVFGVAGMISGLADSTPKAEKIDFLSKGNASIIYDSKQNKIQSLDASDSNQIFVSINKMPEFIQQAFVASEDKLFFQHHGIDVQEILHSIYGEAMEIERYEAASNTTITQKLLNNQMMNNNRGSNVLERFERKLKEQYLAVDLENKMPKTKILEYYLNTINLGQNIVGVASGAKCYFDKDISEVTLSEAVVLAATAVDPNVYDPIKKQEKNQEKYKDILKQMLEMKYISENEYEDALGEDVYLKIQNIFNTNKNIDKKVNSYYVDAAIEQVIDDLKNKLGYSQTQAYNAIYHGGLKIYTCQDKEIQKICDKEINSDKYYPVSTKSYLSYELVVMKKSKEKKYNETDIKNFFLEKYHKKISLYFDKTNMAKKYIRLFKEGIGVKNKKIRKENYQLVKQPQSSFVLMKQSTGEIKAIVGGRGQKLGNRSLNRATESKREPGTILGILDSYIPALDTAGMSLGDVYCDDKFLYPNSNTEVKDWESGKYKKQVTIRQAIVDSINIPAVKVLQKISVQTGYEYLKKMGITTLVEQKKDEESNTHTDLQLPMALGILEDGVTNLEITAAYAAIANEGNYQVPRFYNKVIDQSGNIILDNSPSKTRVMKDTTAWLMTSALMDAAKKGTGKKASLSEKEIQMAGKSGTAFNKSDCWFIGYTPAYTAGIWSGEDEKSVQNSSGYQQKIWKAIMDQVHLRDKIPVLNFKKPSNIIKKKICCKCGKLAIDGICNKAEDKNCVDFEYFEKGTEPTQKCDCHYKYAFCKITNELAGENCPKRDIYYKVLFDDRKQNINTKKNYKICEYHNLYQKGDNK